MSQYPNFSLVSSFLYLISLLSLLSFTTSKSNGFSFELIHPDSPESPLYPGILTDIEKVNRLVEFSLIRANYLESDISSSAFSPKPLRFPVAQDYSSYVVKIQLGNPGIPLYLIPDTGSNLVWTQCEPCMRRFRQNPPIYNSSASRTYGKIPCEHPFCRRNSPFFKCIRNECVYEQEYLSGSVTKGVASKEVFQSSHNEQISINFGCSRDNRNFPSFERTGKLSGIMGLNKSPISLVQQLSNITHGRFSYCLIAYNSGANTSHSLLRFGNDIPTHGRRFVSTPFVHAPNRGNYYLCLLDISVAGRRLRLSPNTFMLRSDGSGGCIIDTGTPLTILIQNAYQQVLNEFQNHLDRHGFRRAHVAGVGLELCYFTPGSSGSASTLPSMTYHFNMADFVVEPQYVFLLVNQGAAFCLALKSTTRQTILGAINQGNTRFIYDEAAGRLQFAPENCLHDRSQDYNLVLYCLQQLFEKVELDKPAAILSNPNSPPSS